MTTSLLSAAQHSTANGVPRAVKWTVAEFHRANEQKFWGEGRRTILIRGVVMEQGPMNPLHAGGVRRMNTALSRLFGPGYVVQAQLPLVLNLDTDPVPDFAVIAGAVEDFDRVHPSTAALVVEVSDSSLFFDTTTKAELYATANILDYWVLDVENRRLIVFRDPAPVPDGSMAYRARTEFGPTDSIAPLVLPDAPIRVADLLA